MRPRAKGRRFASEKLCGCGEKQRSREAEKSQVASGDEAQVEIRARLCKRPCTPEDGRRAMLAYIGWSGMQTRLKDEAVSAKGTDEMYNSRYIPAVPARPSARLA